MTFWSLWMTRYPAEHAREAMRATGIVITNELLGGWLDGWQAHWLQLQPCGGQVRVPLNSCAFTGCHSLSGRGTFRL